MQKLYQKSEILFSIVWIAVYVAGTSVADTLSDKIGTAKLITLILHVVLCAALLIWIKKNALFIKYGICKPKIKASKLLFYIPLAVSASCNLWFGISCNLSVFETVLYISSMICVGFLEELIFRGFLFKAMSKDSIKSAVIVSSITFGIGHIINLFNSSGADLVSNLCQVFYAAAFGFLFVILFIKTQSLLPCIVAHGATNALSVFENEGSMTNERTVIISVIITVIAIGYSAFLIRTLPQKENLIS